MLIWPWKCMLFQSETIKTLIIDTNGTISEVHFYNKRIFCKSLSGRRVGSFIHYNCINIVSILTLTKIHVSAYASLANRFRNIYASKFPGSSDPLTTLHSWRKRKRSLYGVWYARWWYDFCIRIDKRYLIWGRNSFPISS